MRKRACRARSGPWRDLFALTFVAAGILLIGCVGVSSGVYWRPKTPQHRHPEESRCAAASSAHLPRPGRRCRGDRRWSRPIGERPVRRRPAAAGRLASGQSTLVLLRFWRQAVWLSGGAAVLAAAAGTLRSQRPQILFTATWRHVGDGRAAAGWSPLPRFRSSDGTVRRRDALADRGVGVHHGRRAVVATFCCWVMTSIAARTAAPVSGSRRRSSVSR